MSISPEVIGFIERVGVPTAILLGITLVVWKYAIPTLFKRLEDSNKERQTREEEARRLALEDRNRILQEMQELKTESRQDKRLMYDAFLKNVEANTKLQTTLEGLGLQLRDLTEEIMTLKADVSQVYVILGERRKLLSEKQESDKQ